MSKFLKNPDKIKEEYRKRKENEIKFELDRLSRELTNRLELNKTYNYAFTGCFNYDEQILVLEKFIEQNGDTDYGFYIEREPGNEIIIRLVKYDQLASLKNKDTYDYQFGVIKDFIKTYNIIEREADKLYEKLVNTIEEEIQVTEAWRSIRESNDEEEYIE